MPKQLISPGPQIQGCQFTVDPTADPQMFLNNFRLIESCLLILTLALVNDESVAYFSAKKISEKDPL